MKRKKRYEREDVLAQMMKLAQYPANDGVRLAMVPDLSAEEINGMDLTGLTEFKRGSNGTVEIKFSDRLGVLESLLAQLEGGREEKAIAFLKALEEREEPVPKQASRR